ncbi:MAG TPA: hypothetical protein VKB88_32340 [Bryobacteraceae bacterium]|nr:hypothetical protein [Bryobacteraceae bacterium]
MRQGCEHCQVIDAWRRVRQGILRPGWIGRQAWSSTAATGIVPLHLHYELYERWDGTVVRLSYDLQEIGDQHVFMYYEIRGHPFPAAPCTRFSRTSPPIPLTICAMSGPCEQEEPEARPGAGLSKDQAPVDCQPGLSIIRCTWKTKQGYEILHTIRKGQVRWLLKDDVLRQIQFIPETLALKS